MCKAWSCTGTRSGLSPRQTFRHLLNSPGPRVDRGWSTGFAWANQLTWAPVEMAGGLGAALARCKGAAVSCPVLGYCKVVLLLIPSAPELCQLDCDGFVPCRPGALSSLGNECNPLVDLTYGLIRRVSSCTLRSYTCRPQACQI